MKQIYKKELIQHAIYGAEKVIARGDKVPEEAIEDARHFIDVYNKYPHAYLGEEGDISIARRKL